MSRSRPTHRAQLASLALAASGAVALAGCSGSVTGAPAKRPHHSKPAAAHRVDTAALEQAISATARRQRHERVSVVCPPAVDVASRFYCAAQSNGEVTPFLVTRHADGKLSYEGIAIDKAPSVDMAAVEIEIAQKLNAAHKHARSVLCPQAMPVQKGLVFTCAVRTGAKTPMTLVVRETNTLGSIAFETTSAAAGS